MTVVSRRISTHVVLATVTLEELRLIALKLVPGRVQKLWDDDLLMFEQAVAMLEARVAAGLEP